VIVHRLEEQIYTRFRTWPGHPQNRQTFTLAHELYHHLVAEQGAWNGRSRFHASSSDQNCPEIREERQANRFAAALLMPSDSVRALLGQGLSTVQLADRCGVSADAMEIRLKELRLWRG
jgi:Zn-dependent peptidase ImmA (M78 family)